MDTVITSKIYKIQESNKQVMTELKNATEGLNSELDEVKAPISKLKPRDKAMQITHRGQQDKKIMFKREEALRTSGTSSKQSNIHMVGVPEEERKGQKKYLKKLWQKLS